MPIRACVLKAGATLRTALPVAFPLLVWDIRGHNKYKRPQWGFGGDDSGFKGWWGTWR